MGGNTGELPDLDAPHRLSMPCRMWRIAVTLLVVGGSAVGTWQRSDQSWPFAPMSQFAFAISNSGEIHSHYLEAVTLDGQRVTVDLQRGGLGVQRAEIEGQLARFVTKPELLQAIAVAHARRQPDEPRYREVLLMDQVTMLDHGLSSGSHVDTMTGWTVIGAEDPQEIP